MKTEWKWNAAAREWRNGITVARSVVHHGTKSGRRKFNPQAWTWSVGSINGFAATGDVAKAMALAALLAGGGVTR